MPYTPDHSGNLPHEFTVCDICGHKGVYRVRPEVLHDGSIRERYWRCKYCGRISYQGPRALEDG